MIILIPTRRRELRFLVVALREVTNVRSIDAKIKHDDPQHAKTKAI
jgi:hypothetical protein